MAKAMRIRESTVAVLKYEPAWSFAESARRRYAEVPKLPPPYHIGEASLLVFIYSTLSLEAFISEALVSRQPEDRYLPLLDRKVHLTSRWIEGSVLCAGKSNSCQSALEDIRNECSDLGNYGLMVRARNKLVHPKVHKEILDEQGHKIRDDSIDRLVSELQQPPANLPDLMPAFPDLIKCAASAKWSLLTLSRMVRLFYEAVGEAIGDSWQKVLIIHDI